MKQAHPSCGAAKVVARLKLDHPDLAWPAKSTAEAILGREGLVMPRRHRRRAADARRSDAA